MVGVQDISHHSNNSDLSYLGLRIPIIHILPRDQGEAAKVPSRHFESKGSSGSDMYVLSGHDIVCRWNNSLKA